MQTTHQQGRAGTIVFEHRVSIGPRITIGLMIVGYEEHELDARELAELAAGFLQLDHHPTEKGRTADDDAS